MNTRKHILLLGGSLALVGVATLEAQTTPGPQPNICTRGCWAARAPNCALTTSAALTRAIVHHTAAASDWNTTTLGTSQAKIRAVQNYHMDTQGWCDIGYNFLFDKLGNIFEGRADSMTTLRRGIHDACNANSFGFTMLGYFHTPYNHVPTQAMLDSFYATIAWRMPSGWSPYGAGTYCSKTVGFLDGHRKVVATACPGDLVHPNLITENYNGGPMRTAVAARRTPASSPHVRYLSNGNVTQDIPEFNFGVPGDLQLSGDWDGNGSMTPGVLRGSVWYMRNANNNGGVDITFTYGNPGDRPVVGDWDGNGTFTAGIMRGDAWYLNNVNDGSTAEYVFTFGVAGDLPFAGDWDGNGTFTPGVFRASNLTFYLRNSNSSGGVDYVIPIGNPGDVPIVGDWNGDGIYTVGVYRPSEAKFYLRTSNSGAAAYGVVSYGNVGETPIVGDWDGNNTTTVGVLRTY